MNKEQWRQTNENYLNRAPDKVQSWKNLKSHSNWFYSKEERYRPAKEEQWSQENSLHLKEKLTYVLHYKKIQIEVIKRAWKMQKRSKICELTL